VRIHVLVEGLAEEVLLKAWLPRFLPQHSFRLITHRGKGRLPGDPRQSPPPHREGLLDQLPAKLRAYGKSLDPATDRVLVLVDLDDDDCHDLKRRLLAVLGTCDPEPVVLFRIAIEETEAFYLGDAKAIRQAFPRANLARIRREYVQDGICGTWEFFQKVIGARTEDKPGWAERIAPHLGADWRGRNANASPSFQHFCIALRRLAGESVE